MSVWVVHINYILKKCAAGGIGGQIQFGIYDRHTYSYML